MKTIAERWKDGDAHDPRSERMARELGDIDFQMGDDTFGFKFGGDGDNGEHLMYLMDIYFERRKQY